MIKEEKEEETKELQIEKEREIENHQEPSFHLIKEEKEKEKVKRPLWSEAQQVALNLFEEGKNIFLSGPGGSGKTQLIKEFQRRAHERGQKIEILALTGCAAILIDHAKTLHSFFMLGQAKESAEKMITKCYRKMFPKFRKLSILVIDEISMMSARLFETVIGILRRCNCFHRIQLIFVGDFFQLPPVFESWESDKRMCFEHESFAEIFPSTQTVLLNKIFRQEDLDFQRILNNMRFGQILPADVSLLFRYLHRPIRLEDTNGIIPCKLFSRKKDVDDLNKRELDKLPSETIFSLPIVENEYFENTFELRPGNKIHPFHKRSSSSSCLSDKRKKKKKILDAGVDLDEAAEEKEEQEQEEEADEMPSPEKLQEEVDYLTKDIKEPLQLKVGAQVMLTKNINLEEGLCNGKQGKIIGFVGDHPEVLFVDGKQCVITRFKQASDKFPRLSVHHYPLLLAWAITIHKMQGASLTHAEMNLGSSIFADGQMYVALSRVRSLHGLYLTAFDPNKLSANLHVKKFYFQIAFAQLLANNNNMTHESHPMKKKIREAFLIHLNTHEKIKNHLIQDILISGEDLANVSIFESQCYRDFIQSLRRPPVGNPLTKEEKKEKATSKSEP